jgi:SAM-dependent methyltransferase
MKYDQQLVTDASEYLFGQGIRVLQGNRFAETETDHLEKLAGYMQLDSEKEIADMGCGFGEVSRFLSDLNRNAHFWLINTNQSQLLHCPKGSQFTARLEDMCGTSIPEDSVDLIIFNYSLCHVDPAEALREAARIGNQKARLFVYDYRRIGGDDSLTEEHLAAHFLRDWQFNGVATLAGWREIEALDVPGDDRLFKEAVADDSFYHSMFDYLCPVIWRAKL